MQMIKIMSRRRPTLRFNGNHLPSQTQMTSIYDASFERVYIPGGQGFINVFAQSDADHHRLLAEIPSALGARTAGYASRIGKKGSGRFYLAVRGRGPGTTAQKFGSFRRRSDLQYRGILGCNLFADC